MQNKWYVKTEGNWKSWEQMQGHSNKPEWLIKMKNGVVEEEQEISWLFKGNALEDLKLDSVKPCCNLLIMVQTFYLYPKLPGSRTAEMYLRGKHPLLDGFRNFF